MLNEVASVEFSIQQIKASCIAMLAVARAHGITPAELELIRAFWTQADGQLGVLDESTTAAFSPELFGEEAHKLLLLDMCLACAFADGKFSGEEKAVIAGFAAKLGVSEQALSERTAEVRASFLGALSHLPDASSVAALAKNLA